MMCALVSSSACSPWGWHRKGAEELLSHKAQCCFENAELCVILTQPKRCPHGLEIGPAMGDPQHVFQCISGNFYVLWLLWLLQQEGNLSQLTAYLGTA